MTISPFDPLRFPRYPLNNITPFTYRDGRTFLELLEGLRQYIANTIVPGIDANFDLIVQNYLNALTELEAENDATVDALNVLYNDFTADINAQVEFINNKTGPVNVQFVTLVSDYVVAIDPQWPTQRPVEIVFTQDANGNHAVTLPANVSGSVDVDPKPGARTYVMLVPASSDQWFAHVSLSRELLNIVGGNTELTDGDIVRIGRWAFFLRSDVNMGIVAGGGENNENVVGGNIANVNTATSNLLGVPTLTGNDGNWCYILSGYDNVANGWAIVMNGFHNKVSEGGNHATISGGSMQSIGACNYATIGGGSQNSIGDNASGSVIPGGVGNTITTPASANIAGGSNNTVSGSMGAVTGGTRNTASGANSSVHGGADNTAAGGYSVASGRGANATLAGMRTHGAMFTAAGDAQDIFVIAKRETTSEAALALQLDTLQTLVIPENTTWVIDALVVARRTDTDGENAAWRVTAVVKRDAGSTTALVGSSTVTSIGANAGNAWSLAFGINTPGNVNFTCTGEAGKTVRWVGQLRIVQVQG